MSSLDINSGRSLTTHTRKFPTKTLMKRMMLATEVAAAARMLPKTTALGCIQYQGHETSRTKRRRTTPQIPSECERLYPQIIGVCQLLLLPSNFSATTFIPSHQNLIMALPVHNVISRWARLKVKGQIIYLMVPNVSFHLGS